MRAWRSGRGRISCPSPGENDGIHVDTNAGKFVLDKLVTFERPAFVVEGLGLEAFGLPGKKEYIPCQ